MIPSAFAYYAPTSVAEAISLLTEHGDAAKLLAGGHSLLPAMKLRLAAPELLIDLGKIAELRTITVTANEVAIGSMATWAAVAQHPGVLAAAPVLAEAITQIGDIQVRNRGTLGGSLAHNDPAADAPAVILALDATLTLRGPRGERTLAARDFFVDMLATALEPDEVLTTIRFRPLATGAGAAYRKLAHPASRYAIVGVAAYVQVAEGRVTACRVAVTGAGPVAVHQPSVEQALVGAKTTEAALIAACSAAGDDLDILGDMHASEAYRRAMVKVYARRALQAAMAQATA
ncbi:MAG: FAD binding domain-containing protein [Oscillochloridaceae bacterium umkhey_bin13]